MNDILNEITKAEEKAEKIAKDAQKQAEAIIENAKEQIEKNKKRKLEKAETTVQLAIEEKRMLGMYEADKILEKTEKDIEILTSLAEKNREKAVEKILSFV